ncbi:MAG: ribonucleoside-diphosphate reductase subunit alpha, partial [Burkholderiales bacterium]|nr:ribonucleoside-diphosphate reductase subunit alpha [Burkholderiales bacterium]
STDLAEERGRYASFAGSTWDRGLLPLDTLELLAQERGGFVELDRSHTLDLLEKERGIEVEVPRGGRMDWTPLRAKIASQGMRNSNCLAIAPTATISNITATSPCIEPTYKNLFVKSNLSGEFTVVNEYLVRDLKQLELWDNVMISDLKYFDGAIGRIDRIPLELRKLYATAFEMKPTWLVEAGARRQKWIDQSQSLNLYVAGVSGKKLDELYRLAWRRGLKTTYYLRTLSATSAEKSTGRGGELNAVPLPGGEAHELAPALCAIEDPSCESCQ